MNALEKVSETGILPVIAVPSPEAAEPLAAALVAGGAYIARASRARD